MDAFKHYDNPIRARRVWNAYENDFTEGNIIQARAFVQECRTADDLDIKLDILVGKPVHIVGNDAPSLNDIDPDFQGSWTNVVRAYEEDH